MRCLTVAAHPDDEILGCGATMARLAAEGAEVHVVILGEGATSRGDAPEPGRSETERLREQARRACAIVGAKSVEFEALPDNRFDELPLLEIVKRVETHVARVRPERVFTHHPGDLNVDHQLTCRAVVTATRTLPGQVVRELLSFEVPSSSEWAFGTTGPAFAPNCFVDVGGSLERKLEAMTCYESEMRPFPHPRSARALAAIATRWGSTAGCEAAEAFQIVRTLR